jgi:hypothetical protein
MLMHHGCFTSTENSHVGAATYIVILDMLHRLVIVQLV